MEINFDNIEIKNLAGDVLPFKEVGKNIANILCAETDSRSVYELCKKMYAGGNIFIAESEIEGLKAGIEKLNVVMIVKDTVLNFIDEQVSLNK